MKTEQLSAAASSIKARSPSYIHLIDFFEPIFIAQETAKNSITLPQIAISPDIVTIKTKNDFSLITKSEFKIDFEATRRLFLEICNIANSLDTNLFLSNTLAVAQKNVETGKIDIKELSNAVLEENDAYFEDLGKQFQINPIALYFATYHSLRPSIERYATLLSDYLDSNQAWKKGYCPICGSYPYISSLEQDGVRYVYCGFCGHRWNVSRIFCVFCENQDQKELYYLYTDEEKEYRIDGCEHCKKYIKTIDIRNMERPFYPPLEQIATIHLDMTAKNEGLKISTPKGWKIYYPDLNES